MGADTSKPFGDEYLKKKGGFLGLGGSTKQELHNSELFCVYVMFLVKIVLRGYSGVGKTSLFDVFQGKSCPVEHKPSQQINTTTALWTNYLTKERVKVAIVLVTFSFRLRFGMLLIKQV